MKQDFDRRLVAVMFTDMVGYTALFQADEHLALDKRDRYVGAVERHHEAFGGTIMQRLGDGSMSMFPGSLAAVQAAVEIQRELAPHDVPVRIGIHVGEVIVEPHGLVGDAVNVASRIESFAAPGGVMLSDRAQDQIKNRLDIPLVGLGRFRLKNVGRPFELYAVAASGIVVPDERALEGKGERFASLPGGLPVPGTAYQLARPPPDRSPSCLEPTRATEEPKDGPRRYVAAGGPGARNDAYPHVRGLGGGAVRRAR